LMKERTKKRTKMKTWRKYLDFQPFCLSNLPAV
jgi:hypothetical protein